MTTTTLELANTERNDVDDDDGMMMMGADALLELLRQATVSRAADCRFLSLYDRPDLLFSVVQCQKVNAQQ